VETSSAIRTAYFLRVPNVGDRINADIVEALTGVPTLRVRDLRTPHLLAAGSVMGLATPVSVVWGTGVMHPDRGVGQPDGARIHALRGPLTMAAVRKAGVSVGDVPLGDPGFLAPRLLGVARAAAPCCRVGVMPHYVDQSDPVLRRIAGEDGVAFLNVHDTPEALLRQMADCEVVLSSSLHGLIFAEALGLPNLWIKAGDRIAGHDFKFHDWFATTRQPQRQAHALRVDDTAASLAARAVLHASTIDGGALADAFPRAGLGDCLAAVPPSFASASDCRRRPLPVFLISYNRGDTLLRAVAGIRRQTRATHLVVHDNGSTDPRTLAVLAQLESEGARVFRRPVIASPEELNAVDLTVQEYFADWGEPSRYVVSDCDVDLSTASPDALDLFDDLLNEHLHVECVGPMLRIRDVPRDFPLFNWAMNRHIELLWQHPPTVRSSRFGEVAVIETVIDTTLALHRAGEPFARLKKALRVYEPFEALHLDWYRREADDDQYTRHSSQDVSHWNNLEQRRAHRHEPLRFDCFNAVRRRPDGSIEVYVVALSDPWAEPSHDYASAAVSERQTWISRTEELIRERRSDTRRWGNPSAHREGWASRGVALADLVRPGESVFEFGAGTSAIGAALPAGTRYQPSDLVPLAADVMPFDLNAASLSPVPVHDVAVMSGVLEYVHDLPRLVHFLAEHFRTVVCSYPPLVDGSADELAQRRYSGWFNDLRVGSLVALFNRAGFAETSRHDWHHQVLFRFDRMGAVRRWLRSIRPGR
jgi:Polysaccharide pyruvyl transferase